MCDRYKDPKKQSLYAQFSAQTNTQTPVYIFRLDKHADIWISK